jgi:hypothetical protein
MYDDGRKVKCRGRLKNKGAESTQSAAAFSLAALELKIDFELATAFYSETNVLSSI